MLPTPLRSEREGTRPPHTEARGGILPCHHGEHLEYFYGQNGAHPRTETARKRGSSSSEAEEGAAGNLPAPKLETHEVKASPSLPCGGSLEEMGESRVNREARVKHRKVIKH
jgi:hypothetical protein